MNEQPVTITASDFVKQDFAAKIAAGECEVRFLGQLVRALSIQNNHGEDSNDYMIWPINDHEIAGFAEFDDMFTVVWLEPQPPPRDLHHENERLTRELEAARDDLIDAKGRIKSLEDTLQNINADATYMLEDQYDDDDRTRRYFKGIVNAATNALEKDW